MIQICFNIATNGGYTVVLVEYLPDYVSKRGLYEVSVTSFSEARKELDKLLDVYSKGKE